MKKKQLKFNLHINMVHVCCIRLPVQYQDLAYYILYNRSQTPASLCCGANNFEMQSIGIGMITPFYINYPDRKLMLFKIC